MHQLILSERRKEKEKEVSPYFPNVTSNDYSTSLLALSLFLSEDPNIALSQLRN